MLVEAKAHWDELKVKDQCGSTNSDNTAKIAKAIDEAKTQINAKISPAAVSISKDKCYQLSNRVAHAWWLVNQGIPVVLLYLGILNRIEMEDGQRKIFTKHKEWVSCFHDHAKNVGVDSLFNIESVEFGKSGLQLIVRSI